VENGEKLLCVLEVGNLSLSEAVIKQDTDERGIVKKDLKRKALLPASWKQRNPFSYSLPKLPIGWQLKHVHTQVTNLYPEDQLAVSQSPVSTRISFPILAPLRARCR